MATIAGLLGLAVLGLVLGERSGWPFLRAPLQAALSRAAGVDVALEGEFRARFLSRPQLAVGEMRVATARACAACGGGAGMMISDSSTSTPARSAPPPPPTAASP